MPDDIVIRVANEKDAPELARLNAAFNDVYEPPEALIPRFADPQRVETPLIAMVGGRAVGFAAVRVVHSLFYAHPHAELTELYVEPTFRRQGIARGLIALAERVAAERGARTLTLLTGADNLPARALYGALGYVEDDISLTKTLGPPED